MKKKFNLSNNQKYINITKKYCFFPLILAKITSMLIFNAGKGEGNGHFILLMRG